MRKQKQPKNGGFVIAFYFFYSKRKVARMKVLEKGVMPNKTKIQIEDWSGDYTFLAHADTIAAYPTNRHGERFRAEKRFESGDAAACAFKELLSGKATLDDYGFTTMHAGRSIPYQEKM